MSEADHASADTPRPPAPEPVEDEHEPIGFAVFREVAPRRPWRALLVTLVIVAVVVGLFEGALAYHHRSHPFALPASFDGFHKTAATPALRELQAAASSRHVKNTGAAAYTGPDNEHIALLAVASTATSMDRLWRDLYTGIKVSEPLPAALTPADGHAHVYCNPTKPGTTVCSWYDDKSTAFLLTNVQGAASHTVVDDARSAVESG